MCDKPTGVSGGSETDFAAADTHVILLWGIGRTYVVRSLQFCSGPLGPAPSALRSQLPERYCPPKR